jgi:hypothetical protein
VQINGGDTGVTDRLTGQVISGTDLDSPYLFADTIEQVGAVNATAHGDFGNDTVVQRNVTNKATATGGDGSDYIEQTDSNDVSASDTWDPNREDNNTIIQLRNTKASAQNAIGNIHQQGVGKGTGSATAKLTDGAITQTDTGSARADAFGNTVATITQLNNKNADASANVANIHQQGNDSSDATLRQGGAITQVDTANADASAFSSDGSVSIYQRAAISAVATGGDGADTIDSLATKNLRIDGGGGNDTIVATIGEGGSARITGGAGNDVTHLHFGGGNATVNISNWGAAGGGDAVTAPGTAADWRYEDSISGDTFIHNSSNNKIVISKGQNIGLQFRG